MQTVEVDFEVYKQLTVRRATEQVTYNDVIRELLGIKVKAAEPLTQANGMAAGDWVTKGVRFPAGTEFRSEYKGNLIAAKVESGALVLNGTRFDSASAAAMSVTDSAVNGWVFWECRLPGQSSWKLIKSLRRK
jgi:predicted CopG family antitoxin